MNLNEEQLRVIKNKIDKIALIASRDTERNIKTLFEVTKGDLFDAAYSIASHSAPHIAIITGFYIHNSLTPEAETDGPVGAAHLAKSFLNMGVSVNIITDTLCTNVVKTALKAIGIEQYIPIHQVPVDLSENEHKRVLNHILDNWENEKPPISHVIAIERPGISHDGNIYNMNGENISNYTVSLDHLFIKKSKLVRIGIGDGGNEMGMGKLSHRIITENILYGSIIASNTSCEHLIVSGISNWGCYALVAALALLLKDKSEEIMKNFSLKTDREILFAIVNEAHAVDGVTGLSTLSVDGLNWEHNAKIMEEIIDIINSDIIHSDI